MARLLDDASSEKIEVDVAAIADEPMTFSCWFRSDALDYDSLLGVGGGDGGALSMWRIGVSALGEVFCQSQTDSGTSGIAITGGGVFTVDTWHHIAGTISGQAARSVFFNGSETSNTTDIGGGLTVDRTSIGVSPGNLGSAGFTGGTIAEVGIWDVALSASEIASLAKGMRPTRVRPQSLVSYMPLIREIIDPVGNLAFAATGTVVANHPRVF